MLTPAEQTRRSILLTSLENALGPQISEVNELVEIERKDADPSHGPPFERGLPSLADRLAHPGPWESWESPMDRCIVWFSPDGTGYDVVRGHSTERTFHAVTIANWESTWMRQAEAIKPAIDFEAEPTKERIPNPRTCGVARARVEKEPEWVREMERLGKKPHTIGDMAELDRFGKLTQLAELRRVVLSGLGEAEVPRAVRLLLAPKDPPRADLPWSIYAISEATVYFTINGVEYFSGVGEVLDAIDTAGAEILAIGSTP